MMAGSRRTTISIDPLLSRLAYRCYPAGCPSGRTCCVGLAVEVSRGEVRKIDSIMDELARLVPGLREGRGFANVFSDEARPVQIEPRDESGTCPFLFRAGGHALCSIHHTASTTGREVAAYKPRSCRHWPLIVVRHRGRLRLTVHPSAERIGCVAPVAELPGQPTVLQAFAGEIEEIVGRRSPARR